MKIVYIANTCEHVVRPMCDGLYKELGNDFIFIETMELDSARNGIGSLETRPYIFNAIGREEEAKKLCDDAEVVIFAGVPLFYIENRIKNNKPTIYYSERLFKKGFYRFFIPSTMLKVIKRYVIPSKKSNFYVLCASSYASLDFCRIGAFKNKAFKWGYQIKVNEKDLDLLLSSKAEDGLDLLWVGRLVALKHCDDAIRVVHRLKSEGYNPRLTIIGSGVEEQNLKDLTNKLGLEDSVTFKGVLKIDETRSQMDKANVFMFTSDSKEGWGATLNECMNSACACVASHEAGSTNFLINNEADGIVYQSGNQEELYAQVKRLIDDKEFRNKISSNAYKKMVEVWNPSKSYIRLLELVDSILKKEDFNKYKDGPCSKALPIKSNWYKKLKRGKK